MTPIQLREAIRVQCQYGILKRALKLLSAYEAEAQGSQASVFLNWTCTHGMISAVVTGVPYPEKR